MNERNEPEKPEAKSSIPVNPPTAKVKADGEALVTRLQGLLIQTKQDAQERLAAAAKKRELTGISSST